MKLRDLMIKHNEKEYYNIKETFRFHNRVYKSELHFAYLNSEIDKVFDKYNLDYDESYILLDELNGKNLEKYMNRVVRELLFDKGVDDVTSREVMYDLTNIIDDVCFLIDRGSKTSLDISLISLAKAMIEDPKVNEFFNRKPFDENAMTADEIFAIRLKETQEMTNMHIPGLSDMMRSGGIKSNQMYNIFKGLVMRTRVNNPTEIYPRLIDERWIDGLRSKESLFIESSIARKSMLMNKQNIARAGVHNRESSILAQDTKITATDCGSKHYMEYFVADQKILDSLEFKYRLTENGTLEWIKKTDTFLIGTTVKVRSVLKCCAPDGGVCETCFGYHAKWNRSTKEYPFDIGVEFSKSVNAPISQLVLSFKHNASPFLKPSQIVVYSLMTGEFVDLDSMIKRVFNKLLLKDKVKAYILEEDILLTKKEEVKYFDNEFGEWDIIRVNKVFLEFNGQEYVMEDHNEVPLRVKGKQFERYQMKRDGSKVYLNPDDVITHILVNAHSTMKYMEVIDLYNIDTSKMKDLDDHVKYFMDQVLASSMKGENITTLEVMFKNKVRDPKSYKESKTPDWTSDEPSAVVLSLERAINKNLSLSSKIPAGQLDKNFKDPFYHDPRNLRSSSYDILYDNKSDAFNKEEDESDII